MRLNKNQRLRGRINLINTQRLAPKEMHSHQQSALKRLYVTLCSDSFVAYNHVGYIVEIKFLLAF